jgi:chromosomal replication initiation ATPase DnaA
MMDRLIFTQTDTIDQELLRFSRSVSLRDRSLPTNPLQVADLLKIVEQPEVKAKRIIEQSCELFEVNREQLLSRSRLRPLPQIRQVMMWYFWDELGMTGTQSSAMFGLKHSMCTWACKMVYNREKDFVLNDIYNKFMTFNQ